MNGRTGQVTKNIIFAVVFQLFNIAIKMMVRTVFIRSLGKEYLGIGGVFSNVLTVLSLAEMGIGTVIVYDMYKPIAENDHYHETQLFDFYRKAYMGIALLITMAGLILMPFLNVILTDTDGISNVTTLYLLHLLSAVSSYFYAQYSSLLNAHQLNRINSVNSGLISIVKTLLEITVLIVFKSYVAYLLVEILMTIAGNYVLSRYVRRRFPYIQRKTAALSKERKNIILSNARNMLAIRVSGTVVNATDNIVISTYISTVLVGVYSNYSLIIQIVLTSIFLIESSLLGSVGNLCASENSDKRYDVFLRIRFFYSCIFCFISTALIILLNPFITLWIGKEYVLDNKIVLLIVFNCYLSGIRQPIEIFINGSGLFQYFKRKPFIEVAINLAVSIIGAKRWGIFGVLFGTTVSHVATTFWYDPMVVYRHCFGKKLSQYFRIYGKALAVTVISIAIAAFFQCHVNSDSVGTFLIRIMIVCMASVGTCFLGYCNSREIFYYRELIKRWTKHGETDD